MDGAIRIYRNHKKLQVLGLKNKLSFFIQLSVKEAQILSSLFSLSFFTYSIHTLIAQVISCRFPSRIMTVYTGVIVTVKNTQTYTRKPHTYIRTYTQTYVRTQTRKHVHTDIKTYVQTVNQSQKSTCAVLYVAVQNAFSIPSQINCILGCPRVWGLFHAPWLHMHFGNFRFPCCPKKVSQQIY